MSLNTFWFRRAALFQNELPRPIDIREHWLILNYAGMSNETIWVNEAACKLGDNVGIYQVTKWSTAKGVRCPDCAHARQTFIRQIGKDVYLTGGYR